MNKNPTIQIQIAAACYPMTPGSQPIMVSLVSGPKFTLNNLTTHPDLIARQAHDMLDLFFISLPDHITKTLPSLPDRLEQQPHFLALAHQWLALVENGKQSARCLATQDEDGTRRLTIVMKPSEP